MNRRHLFKALSVMAFASVLKGRSDHDSIETAAGQFPKFRAMVITDTDRWFSVSPKGFYINGELQGEPLDPDLEASIHSRRTAALKRSMRQV